MKKAQLTLVMIVVVVMIALFAFTMFITKSSFFSNSNADIEKSTLTEADLIPVKAYVDSCIDFVTRDGLELFAMQGGAIYESQMGPIPDIDPKDETQGIGKRIIEYEDYLLLYGVLRPDANVGNFFFASPPNYPYVTFPEFVKPDKSLLKEEYDSFVGWSPFPADVTVKEILKYHAENGLRDCVKEDDFIDNNFKLTLGEPNVTINFSKSNMFYSVDYPITVTELESGSSKKFSHFTKEYPIRMQKLLDSIHYVIDKDVSDPRFRTDDFNNDQISVIVDRDVYFFDDVVKFKDPHSKLMDKDYVIRFASKNRHPVLHLPNRSGYRIDMQNYRICEFKKIDIKAGRDFFNIPPTIKLEEKAGITHLSVINPANCSDGNISIPLKQYDPEEDNMTYTFSVGGDYSNVTFWNSTKAVERASGKGNITPLIVSIILKDEAGLIDWFDWKIAPECWEQRENKAKAPCGKSALRLVWSCTPWVCQSGNFETRTCKETTETEENPPKASMQRPSCFSGSLDSKPNLIINSGETKVLSGANYFNQVIVSPGAKIVVGDIGWLEIRANSITINGEIDGKGRGHQAYNGPGKGHNAANDNCDISFAKDSPTVLVPDGCGAGGGAGHVDYGIKGSPRTGDRGSPYGELEIQNLINEIGSGGGSGSRVTRYEEIIPPMPMYLNHAPEYQKAQWMASAKNYEPRYGNEGVGGAGGAAIRLEANIVNVNGKISASGEDGGNGGGSLYDQAIGFAGGAGSGGAIYLIGKDSLQVSPSAKLEANGGNPGKGYKDSQGHGTGRGSMGRIKLESQKLIVEGNVHPNPVLVTGEFAKD